jgi:hypothetical protein
LWFYALKAVENTFHDAFERTTHLIVLALLPSDITLNRQHCQLVPPQNEQVQGVSRVGYFVVLVVVLHLQKPYPYYYCCYSRNDSPKLSIRANKATPKTLC